MQFHFTVWPDRGVPNSPVKFIKFLHATMAAQFKFSQESKTAGEPQCPLLVHCSAGVGRTGTFMAIYSTLNALPMLGKNGVDQIDVPRLVVAMRKCRRYMIQSQAQYEFTHYTILHAAREFQASYKQRSASLAHAVGKSPAAKPQVASASATPSPSAPTEAGRTTPHQKPQQSMSPARRPSAAKPRAAVATAGVPSQPLPAMQPQASAATMTTGPAQAGLPGDRPARLCCPACTIINRSGNCSFINGTYLVQGSQRHDGHPTYKHVTGIPAGYGAVSNKPLVLYYHNGNRAWCVAMELGSTSVLAFIPSVEHCPHRAQGQWHVSEVTGSLSSPPRHVIDIVCSTSSPLTTLMVPYPKHARSLHPWAFPVTLLVATVVRTATLEQPALPFHVLCAAAARLSHRSSDAASL